jgi:hypothetical protein
MNGFNLSRERIDEDVADGVYTVSERHKAGGASFFPDMNNRGFIYHVTNEFGVEHLLLNGIPGPVNSQGTENRKGHWPEAPPHCSFW